MRKISKKAVRSILAFGVIASLLVGGSLTVFAGGRGISRKTAIAIAAKDAGVNTDSAKYKFKEAELDTDNGERIWEIEFYYNGTKYEYDINADTKKIVEKDKTISKARVKKIALKRAKVDSRDARDWDIDHEDEQNYYRVTFRTKSDRYVLRIHSGSGKVLDYQKTSYKKNKNISVSKAKSIVLEHAKISSKDVKRWKIEKETDDGVKIYEIDFRTNKYKYEYDVRMKDGKILKYEKKRIHSASKSKKYIGVDKAKSIALAHAKKHFDVAGEVRYGKAKLERDDGQVYYDVEFRNNGYEFEYEIHAVSGKILEWDIDD